MTTFTQKDTNFWEDYFNERGKSQDESKMSERKTIRLSQFSYLFRDINCALRLSYHDIVADVGCGGGYMSVLFSSLAKKVFAYDIALENINYCKKEHNIPNIEFSQGYIENVENNEINKMFLGAVVQYFSKEQLINFKNSISSKEKFPKLNKIFLSHIPDLDKQFDWLDGYKHFIQDKKELETVRHNQKYYNSWYSKAELEKLFDDSFDVEFSEINHHIPQHKYCFDMLLTRK